MRPPQTPKTGRHSAGAKFLAPKYMLAAAKRHERKGLGRSIRRGDRPRRGDKFELRGGQFGGAIAVNRMTAEHDVGGRRLPGNDPLALSASKASISRCVDR